VKTNVQRIAYYTRKAAAYSRNKRPGRFERLMQYKAALNARLEAERLRPIW
jgi:hypothetical protein